MTRLLVWLATCTVVNAETPRQVDLANAVNWEFEPSWTVRVGADEHRFAFKTGVAGTDSWMPLFNRTTGRGNVGLSNGERRVYDDGAVFQAPSQNIPSARVNSFSQINQNTGRVIPSGIGSPVPISELSFHTFRSTAELQSFTTFHAQRIVDVASPSVELGRHMASFGTFELGISAGWSTSSADQAIRPFVSALATTRESRETFTYRYDFPGAGFNPVFLDDGTFPVIVHDVITQSLYDKSGAPLNPPGSPAPSPTLTSTTR